MDTDRPLRTVEDYVRSMDVRMTRLERRKFGNMPPRGQAMLFHQDTVVADTAGADVKMKLSFIPLDNSEHLYWNGSYQPGAEFEREDYRVTVPGAGVKKGDRVSIEYAHTNVLPEPPLMNPMKCVQLPGNGAPTALPAGTQAGDTLVVTSNANVSADLVVGQHMFGPARRPLDLGAGAKMWVGTATDPNQKVGAVVDSSGGPVSAVALLHSLPGTLDWSRYSEGIMWEQGYAQACQPLAALPGSGSGAVVFQWNYGWIGGGYAGRDIRDAQSGQQWNMACNAGTYHCLFSGWTDRREVGVTNVCVGNTGYSAAMMIGVWE